MSVNSAALARPQLISELADVFGSQCVVLAIDAKREGEGPEAGGAGAGLAGPAPARSVPGARWQAYVAGGRTPTGRDAVQWAIEGVALGAGEILLTSMDADGVGAGYDLELVRAVSGAVTVPVIASGGAGELDHLVDALRAGADAVLCASIFHYGRFSVNDVKRHLRAAGIAVRLTPDS